MSVARLRSFHLSVILILSLAVGLGLTLVPVRGDALEPGRPATTAAGPLSGCTMKANDPHRSSGGRGIDAKSFIQCGETKRDVRIAVQLMYCPDRVLGADGRPELNYPWLNRNCDTRAGNVDTDVTVRPGRRGRVTRQAPPRGSAIRLRQLGMWVNATSFFRNATVYNRFNANRIS